jgi:DNA (cytosine-5)-methyltransferase 1
VGGAGAGEVTAYYNEFDPAAAHILRAMVEKGVIAPGDVDTRSIKEVQPDDLRNYTQCHFFAGGGLWSVAARLAGWPDDAPLWTGSCPCQPFSAAGKGLGTDDPRHLWPDFHRLIRARRPAVVMGEQVAGKAGYGWFDGVRTDLAGEGYAGRAVDFPACSVDAPHQRNRLYWCAVDVADSGSQGLALGSITEVRRGNVRREGPAPLTHDAGGRGLFPDANRGGRAGRQEGKIGRAFERTASKRPLLRNGTYWSDAEWIKCHDDKARRAQSGIRFLVDGLPGRVDLWRVGGNAIVPEAAAEVIAAFMDVYGRPATLAEVYP